MSLARVGAGVPGSDRCSPWPALTPRRGRAWNVCAFVTNARISRAVGSSFSTFNSSMGNLSTYLDDIPQVRAWGQGQRGARGTRAAAGA